MLIKKQVERFVNICDVCKEREAYGVCIYCGKDLCFEDCLKIDVTRSSSYSGMMMTFGLSNDYALLCKEHENVQMPLREFFRKFGCSRGITKHTEIIPV